MLRFSRRMLVALCVSASVFTIPLPAHAAEEEDADSKGDVSTENNPNLGQVKEEKLIQDRKERERDASSKTPSVAQDKPITPDRNETATDRPQRFERPIRPERPHR